VLLLSRILGMDVRGLDRRVLGRVADMAVIIGQHDAAVVDRVLVHLASGHDLMFDWTAVEHFGLDGIRVASGGMPVTSMNAFLGEQELLLRRDVLDTQIVDVAGQRLARVADVFLARRRDGHLEVVAVEVGFGGVLRRLGFARLAARANGDAVALADLHFTSARGHAVQLATPRSAVHRLGPRALAGLVSRLNVTAAVDVLEARGHDVAADVVELSGPVAGERMLRAMSEDEAADVVAAMPADPAFRWRRLLARPRHLRGRPVLRSHLYPRRRVRRETTR
jgi:hypothetical protein